MAPNRAAKPTLAGQREEPGRAQLHHQDAGGVGADAEQAGVAERDLAGVADHDVQAEQQDGVDQDGLGQVHVIRIREQQRVGQRPGRCPARQWRGGFFFMLILS
jgi:hypothetical protein